MVEQGQSNGRVVKAVVVGDGAVGKTCLITAYGENRFPSDYVPTVSDTYGGKVEYGEAEIELSIWDTAGQPEYANVRPLSYNGANVFVICFNLGDKTSLKNAMTAWVAEIKRLGPPCIPIVLCGNKMDLRDEVLSEGNTEWMGESGQMQEIVTKEEGLAA